MSPRAFPRGVIVVIAEDLDGGEIRHTFSVQESFEDGIPIRGKALTCTSKDAEFTDWTSKSPREAILVAGQKLFNALNASPSFQNLLAQMDVGLKGNGAAKTYPLFVRIDDAPDPEALPWEVLWEINRSFFCLDPAGRWPVARLVAGSTHAGPNFRTIEPALRIMLILAAVGASGSDEWRRFSTALKCLKAPHRVLVVVSEDEARDTIQADMSTWGGPNRGEVEFVSDQAALTKRIVSFAPNVLHFFCHGSSEGQSELEIETRSDRRTRPPKDRGSVRLDAVALRPLAGLHSLWLVALNCCRVGKTAANIKSMAKGLAEAGVPAVVAMRESIEVTDANEFTEQFYTTLLTQFNPIFVHAVEPESVNTPVPEVIWMRATDSARRCLSLAPKDPKQDPQWTYPVLYVRGEELSLTKRRVPALTAERKIEISVEVDLLRRTLVGLQPGLDSDTDEKRGKLAASIQLLEDQLTG